METSMLSTRQTAKRWNVSDRRIRESIKAGTVPAIRLGRTLAIPVAFVRAVEAGLMPLPPTLGDNREAS